MMSYRGKESGEPCAMGRMRGSSREGFVRGRLFFPGKSILYLRWSLIRPALRLSLKEFTSTGQIIHPQA
jgi:hypothetical protein